MATKRLDQIQKMVKSGWSALETWYGKYRPWIISGLTVVSILLIVWARFGFTVEVTQFFADAECGTDFSCTYPNVCHTDGRSCVGCSDPNASEQCSNREDQGGCRVAAHATQNCCLDPGNISCSEGSLFQHYNAGSIWPACNGATFEACEFNCSGAPNATCNSAPATHLECRNNACVSVSGSGSNQCSNDPECVAAEPDTHLDCRNNACVEVAGGGSDLCSNNTECAAVTVATHLACQNNACVTVTGSGSDECSNDSQCVVVSPVHLICENNACVTVGGFGDAECSIDADCASTSALACAPVTQAVNVGELAQLSVSGGIGVVYDWSSPSGEPVTGTGDVFEVTYATPGTYEVLVVDIGGAGDEEIQPSVSCEVVVVEEEAVVCTADVQQCPDGSFVGRVAPLCQFAACPESPVCVAEGGGLAIGNQFFCCEGLVRECVPDTDACSCQRPAESQNNLVLNGQIRNFTDGGSYAPQASGRPAQQFQVLMAVSAEAIIGDARNVILSAVLPDSVTYVSSTTTIDNQPTSVDSIAGAGLAVGSFDGPIQVTFRVAIKPAGSLQSGTITSQVALQARADNAVAVNDSVTFIIDNATVVVQVSQVQTGPGDVTLLALMSAALLTLLYVSYTYTHMYRSREVGTITKRRNPLNFK